MNISKKQAKKSIIQDFTINHSANASNPVRTVKKPPTKTATETSWEDIDSDSNITEELNEDGSKKLSFKKKKLQHIPIDDRPGNEYPEIIFYLISKYIQPEDVGRFARINKACHAVTKNKSFWMTLYKTHCETHPDLPEKLKTDSFKAYGLRQTVIRALYHTYKLFIKRIERLDHRPHKLVSRICVNVWFCKGLTYWNVYFKLKKPQLSPQDTKKDFIEEMGRIDANPEEDTQVLLVTCKSFHEVPPIMGMTLCSVSMVLSHGYHHHRLNLGFSTSRYPVKGQMPECRVVLDAVVGAIVCDWWHPQYPHSGTFIPRQDPPLLRNNFFDDDAS